MLNRRLLIAPLLALFGCGAADASLMTYNIDVTVTAAPESPGSYSPDTDYSFGALPASFPGTFMADDTVAGPISGLSLVIGGINIADLGVGDTLFDPTTFTLAASLCCGNSGAAAVVIGDTFTDLGYWSLQPANRIVAIQDSSDGPVVDPYQGYDQNWVGTFTVSKGVPEPTTALLMALGVAGLGFAKRRVPDA